MRILSRLLALLAAITLSQTAAAQLVDMSPVPTQIYSQGIKAGDYDVIANDGRLTAPTYIQPPEVASGVDASSGGPNINAYDPATHPIGSGKAEEQGAFRFICRPGRNRTDDPIIYPGKLGGSHLHQLFGNLKGDAFSTYNSLRATGTSSCLNPLNRSLYWQPVIINGDGWAKNPEQIVIYYKRLPAISGRCTVRVNGTRINYCLPTIPRGLRYVFGSDIVTGGVEGGSPTFVCIPGSGVGRSTQHNRYMGPIKAYCNQPGDRFGVNVDTPGCWDGKNGDTANHRSHMRDSTGDGITAPVCPASHPFILPTYTADALYVPDDTIATWKLSSDFMANGGTGCAADKQGCTLHMDVFYAWEDSVMREWIANCIEGWRTCSAGDLGNGRQLKPDNNLDPVAPYEKNPMKMSMDAGSAHLMHRKN